jgi:hypothetical protein
MTKRDYILLSSTIRYVRELKTTDEDTLDLLSYAFATALGGQSRDFDKARFMADCGCPV